jgi:thioredoxin 1
MVEQLKTEEFKDKVLKSDKTIMVDFYAEWCSPCKLLKPILDKISDDDNNVKFYKVDIATETKLAEDYDILTIPTVIVFKDGKISETINGFRDVDKYKNAIK